MANSTTKILGPTAILIGTIVGAGVFALPAAAAASGFFVMLAWTILLTGVLILVHLMFVEVVVRTKAPHRLPGYVGMYLGRTAKWVSLAVTLVGSVGTLLVYLVLLGQFIPTILPLPEVPTVVFAWVVLSVLVVLGIQTIERVELLMTALLIGVVFFLVFSALPHFTASNLTVAGDDTFLPFGVLLFALGGFVAIPEIRGFFVGDERKYAASIVLGLLTSSVLYIVFAGAFVGAFGVAISGRLIETVALLGPAPLYALTTFGIVAIFTSFLVLGSYVVHTLQLDMGVSQKVSYTILAIPLIIYLFGARDFVGLVSFLGVIFSGVSAFFLLWVWKRARHRGGASPYVLNVPEWIIYPLFVLFGGGVVLTLWRSFL